MFSSASHNFLDNFSFSRRIQALGLIPLVMLMLVGAATVYGTVKLAEAGKEVYAEGVEFTRNVGLVSSLAEELRAGVKQVPGEFLVANQEAIKNKFEENMTATGDVLAKLASVLEVSNRQSIEDLQAVLDELSIEAKTVFQLSAAMQQNEAVSHLIQTIAPIETSLEAALARIAQTAEIARANSIDKLIAIEINTFVLVGGVLAASILLTLVIQFSVSASITTPIGRMTAAMRKLAEGDLETDIPGLDDQHEIGAMANAVATFKENAQQVRAHSELDRQRHADEVERAARLANTAKALEECVFTAVKSIEGRGQELQACAAKLNDANSTLRHQSTEAERDGADTSEAVSAVAASTQQFETAVDEINKQVNGVAEITHKSVEDAEANRSHLSDLDEATKRIGDVVGLISEIAEQTNLLALNATIEAARAGEMGRGFSVVAAEVKALAQQTAKATDDIGVEINRLTSASGSTVEAYAKVGEALAEISHMTGAIAAATNQQEATASEMSRSLAAASERCIGVTRAIENVRLTADSNESLSSEVSGATDATLAGLAKLRGDVDALLNEIKAVNEEAA